MVTQSFLALNGNFSLEKVIRKFGARNVILIRPPKLCGTWWRLGRDDDFQPEGRGPWVRLPL